MKKTRFFQKKLCLLLRPFAVLYGLLLQARRALYAKNIFLQHKTTSPCISVGNISVGGTGKTPLTSWLLLWAEHKQRSAVVLSRGYGATIKNTPIIVSPQSQAHEVGDEPLLLAKEHPNARIITFPKRVISARLAEAELSPDLFILDDGMQHIAIKRDLNIVLLNQHDLYEGWNKVLPEGLWRENKTALTTASAFAIKADKETFSSLIPQAQERLSSFGVPLFSFELHPISLQPLYGTKNALFPFGTMSNEITAIREYMLLSGVGNPDQVEKTVTQLTGRKPLQRKDYEDHHKFSEKDIQSILSLAGSLPILCTAKDAVKFEHLIPFLNHHPVFIIKTEVQFGQALFTDKPFPLWLEQWWKNLSSHQPL